MSLYLFMDLTVCEGITASKQALVISVVSPLKWERVGNHELGLAPESRSGLNPAFCGIGYASIAQVNVLMLPIRSSPVASIISLCFT